MRRPTRTQRPLAVVAAVAASALLVSACSSSEPTADSDNAVEWELTDTTAAPSGDIDSFSWATYAEPYSLDYAYAFDYADNQVLANVCEPLLRLNPDFTLSPGLAESFAQPTPTTWVYSLRDDVTFHDGTALTAADVVASMTRHLDPAVGSFWYSAYQNVVSIEQTGDLEVTVTMAMPDSQFNLMMGSSAGIIESAATLEAAGVDYGNSTTGVNCTGPFAFEQWQSGESITMSRYDDYWDEDLVAHSAEVEFLFMADPNTRVTALNSGEVDGSWMIPAAAVSQLQESEAGELAFGLNTAVSSLIISNLEGPLGDLRVRQALLMALDREGIVEAALGGVGEVTDVLTTESVWGAADESTLAAAFDDVDSYAYDVEAATALIEEAGAAGEEIVIATAPISSEFSVVSQAVAAAAQSIGLTATIETVTPGAYTGLFSDPSAREGIDLFLTGWYLSSPDPLEMYSVLRTGEFSNYGGWSDPEFDEIVNGAIGIADAGERDAETAKAQQIANEQLPWLPLFNAPVSVFMGERITGVQPSIAFLYYPWAATIGAR